MRKTIIHPWTENWAENFRHEAALLEAIFKEELLNIFHIGSTSIPAIGYAKPIIDILIVVKGIEKVDRFNENVRRLGYEPKGENGIKGRRYFSKGKDERTHHVHIYENGNENIDIHLNFKEYLLAHPQKAQQYGSIKLGLLEQFPDDHFSYQEGKQEFVNQLVEEAQAWALTKDR